METSCATSQNNLSASFHSQIGDFPFANPHARTAENLIIVFEAQLVGDAQDEEQ